MIIERQGTIGRTVLQNVAGMTKKRQGIIDSVSAAGVIIERQGTIDTYNSVTELC